MVNSIRPPTYHPVSLLLLGLLGGLGHLATLLNLIYGFDDSHGNRLLHVTNGKTSQGWVLGEGLHTHGLAGHHFNDCSISTLDMLGVILELLATSSIDFLFEFGKLAGDVGSVAVEHRGIAGMDLARVIQDDNL